MAQYEVEYSNEKWIRIENVDNNNVVYKIPYSSIKSGTNCPKIENNFIVYILQGITVGSKDHIYVGKSTKGLDNRPGSHESKYDNWTYCYILTRDDDKLLNDGIIQYLEDTIRRKVDACSDCFINTTDKTSSNTANTRDINKSNTYLKDIYNQLYVLGLDLAPRSMPRHNTQLDTFTNPAPPQEPKSPNPPENHSNKGQFHIKSSKIRADAIIHDEHNVEVLAGSEVVPEVHPKFKDHNYCKLRNELINEGVVKDNCFLKNYTFNSLSAAAAVILGRASNGRIEWLDDNNIPYSRLT